MCPRADRRKALDATDYRVSFIGHSHVALSFHRNEGESATGSSTRRESDYLDISSGEWLINLGSTGQPRDGDPRAAWLVLDTERWTAEWRRAWYDIAGAQAAIRAANLPTPRRALPVRSIAPYAEIAPAWAGARRRPAPARLWQLEPQTDPAGPRRPLVQSVDEVTARTSDEDRGWRRGGAARRPQPGRGVPRQVDRRLKRNLNAWLDHIEEKIPADCVGRGDPGADREHRGAHRDAHRDADRDADGDSHRDAQPDTDRDAAARGDADGGTAEHRRCRSGR